MIWGSLGTGGQEPVLHLTQGLTRNAGLDHHFLAWSMTANLHISPKRKSSFRSELSAKLSVDLDSGSPMLSNLSNLRDGFFLFLPKNVKRYKIIYLHAK